MNNENINQDVDLLDLSNVDKPRNEDDLTDISVDSELTVVSASTLRITIHSVLTLSGVRIPAQGSGYLILWADVYQENGDYRGKLRIGGPDLTPAGPSGSYRSEKVLESIPPGRYRAKFELMSYWKHGGRMKYSTYAQIEGDGDVIWKYELKSTPGQKNPLYEDAKIKFEVTG